MGNVFAGEPRAGGATGRSSGDDRRTVATGTVGRPLGQTGRLSLATDRTTAGRKGRRGLSPTSEPVPGPVEANPQAGGTVRPNTSRGWPAGALRWRVTFAIRSVERCRSKRFV